MVAASAITVAVVLILAGFCTMCLGIGYHMPKRDSEYDSKNTEAYPRRILGIPVGWKDRGTVESINMNGEYWVSYCPFDRTILRVGLEADRRFLFCPRCLETYDVQLSDNNYHGNT